MQKNLIDLEKKEYPHYLDLDATLLIIIVLK